MDRTDAPSQSCFAVGGRNNPFLLFTVPPGTLRIVAAVTFGIHMQGLVGRRTAVVFSGYVLHTYFICLSNPC